MRPFYRVCPPLLGAALLCLTGCASQQALKAARSGDIDALQALHTDGTPVVGQRDLLRRGPVFLAAQAGHTDTVAFLLDNGADINAAHGLRGHSALMAAAVAGHRSTLELLLAQGADVNQRARGGDTALFLTIEQDAQGSPGEGDEPAAPSLLPILLAAGADPNLPGPREQPPLHLASETQQPEVVALLLAAGAEATSIFPRTGASAVIAATAHRDSDILLQLLNAGADPNLPDANGQPPLMHALAAKNPEALRLLLAGGADPNLPAADGETTLRRAQQVAGPDALRVLLAAGADPNLPDADGRTALLRALAASDLDAMKLLLEVGADPDAPDQLGVTPLIQALRQNDATAAGLLLAAGADGSSGYTAPPQERARHRSASQRLQQELGSDSLLTTALARHQPEFVDRLLAHGVVPDAGAMALAVRSGEAAQTARLLAADGDPNGTAEEPLLSLALHGSHLPVAELLLAAGADANIDATPALAPPLVAAAQQGATEMVALLLAAGANVEARNAEQRSALYTAAVHGHQDVVEQLLAAGADIDARNGDNLLTAVAIAAHNGRENIVMTLLSAGANPNLAARDGSTALYFAARGNRNGVVKLLLASGANPDLTAGQHDWSAVHVAANAGNYETVALLLAAGANVNLRDKDGDSPLDLAMAGNLPKTSETLTRYGGRTYNYRPKGNGGDTMMKLFATAAIGTAAYNAGGSSHQTADMFSAAVKDIWVHNGQGNNMAQLAQQYASGNFEVRDPLVRQLFAHSIEEEAHRARRQAELAAAQAEQQRLQQQRQAELRAQQQAQASTAAQQRQQAQQQAQAERARIQAAAVAERERATAEYLARTQQARTQQAASHRPRVAPTSVALRNPAAETARARPQANSASIQRGLMHPGDGVDCDCEGTLTKRHLTVASCQISSITVSYNIGTFFGEPRVGGTYRWQAGADTPADCLPHDFTAWVRIQNDQAYGYVKIDPAVPKAGAVGFNATGSPDWGNFICGFNGSGRSGCFSAEEAKQLIRRGRVTDVLFSQR